MVTTYMDDEIRSLGSSTSVAVIYLYEHNQVPK